MRRTTFSLFLTFQRHEDGRLPVSLDEGEKDMAKLQDIPKEMDNKPSPARSTLSKVTAIALLGTSLAYFVHLLLALLTAHVFIPPVLVVGMVTLLGAALSFLRFRWAPALGAVIALGVIFLQMTVPIAQYTITHPGDDAVTFIVLITILFFGPVAGIAGIAATLQNYRHPGAPAPRNLRLLLVSFATFVVGMMVVSLIVAANPPTSAASTTTNGEPTVHMSATNFVQNVVLVPKGAKLLIVNDSSVEHILQNGAWDANGTPHPAAEPGVPTLHNIDITGGSREIGPFTTAGVFHLYCTIHTGMNLTIVVQ
jgi:plastocyanin